MTEDNKTYGFNGFSGVDMKAVIGEKVIGEISGLNYNLSRKVIHGKPGPTSLSGSLCFCSIEEHIEATQEFDVIISAANEYGALAIMKIIGIIIQDQSELDIFSLEENYNYIATKVEPWKSI